MNTIDILQQIIFPCCRGSYLFSERASLEGVHAFLCAKEINEMLTNNELFLDEESHPVFQTHKEGIEIVTSWSAACGLNYEKEIDISVGVADVIVYADDIGIFEIGTTRPTKIVLLLRYITKIGGFYTVHFWPYAMTEAFIFRNWQY